MPTPCPCPRRGAAYPTALTATFDPSSRFVLTLLYLIFVLLSLSGRRDSTTALRVNKSTRGPLLDSGFGPFQLLEYNDITFVDDIYAVRALRPAASHCPAAFIHSRRPRRSG